MSTVTDAHTPPDPPGKHDPFHIGWRLHKTVGPDGAEHVTKIPLTLEDAHHPREEDFIVQRPGHAEDCIYLYEALKAQLADKALVTFDLRIAWDVPDLEPLGPDLTVIFGGVYDRFRGTYDVAEEGARPAVVFEVVSPNTRANDVGPKVEEYYRCGVEWYVLIDALGFRDGRWDLRVVGYRRGPRGFVAAAVDGAGRLWVEPVGLHVAVRDGRVVAYDAADREILDYVDLSRAFDYAEKARQLADERRDEERRQREKAEKVGWLADEARQQAEQARQDAEQHRDEERRQREAAEKARQLADEARAQADEARQQAEQARQDAERQQGEERRQREEAEKARQQAEDHRDDERRQREAAEKASLQAEKARLVAESAHEELTARLRQVEAELRLLRGPG